MPVTETEPDMPEWDPADPGRIEEPGAPKKAAGWDDGEAPPAKWFNWQWNLVYQWFVYLKDVLANSYNVEHNFTSGTHSDVTADTVDISDTLTVGNADQLTVDDAGNVATSGSVETTELIFTPGFVKYERILMTAGEALEASGDNPGAVNPGGGSAGPAPDLQLLTTEQGVIPFNMGNKHSLDQITLFFWTNVGTTYSFDWQIVRFSEASLTWVAVDASLDGSISGTSAGTGFANIESEDVNVPDFNSPPVAGHGFYTGAGADGDLYGLRVTNTHGSNTINIGMIRTKIWRYGLSSNNGI